MYTSTYNDRYYTNGIFLNYNYVSKRKHKNLVKKIYSWQIGHEMYTPSNAVTQFVNNHDRPFAGYLYAGFGIKKVYTNNSSFAINYKLGILGPSAFGKELQNFIHNLYNFPEAVGWQFQIKNSLAANLQLNYNKFLFKETTNRFDVTWLNTANAGSVNTNIGSGFIARIGFNALQPFSNSIAFNNHLNNQKSTFFRAVETLLYIKPMVNYVLYDATLQGNFLNKGSVVTSFINPVVFRLEVGFLFTAKNVNFGYVFNYNTNKSKDLKNNTGHTFGAIKLSYLLK